MTVEDKTPPASDEVRRDTERSPQAERPKKRVVNGWVVLDKPVGMTSTFAVAAVKRALNAKKAGHAGTLDPLASGILPIALGEATKTVPYVMDGRKSYVFTVAWGVETDTDDAEGKPVLATNRAPERADIEALLPQFTGSIEQVPPRFSAVKIAGERAYDLARDGEVVELKPRVVEVSRLAVVAHHADRSVIEADCGKGTYVRALARDLGRALGCLGHVAALRRTGSGHSRGRHPHHRRARSSLGRSGGACLCAAAHHRGFERAAGAAGLARCGGAAQARPAGRAPGARRSRRGPLLRDAQRRTDRDRRCRTGRTRAAPRVQPRRLTTGARHGAAGQEAGLAPR
jgi:tRNA pseudouridine(55) synthase